MAAWTGRVIGSMVGVVLVLAVTVPAGSVPGSVMPGSVGTDREDLEIVVRPLEPRPDVFVLKGRVKPKYEKKPAILQRRNCRGCSWYAFEKFRTDGESRFKLRVPTPAPHERRKVCYRVKIPRSDQYRRAISAAHCIGSVTPGTRGLD